MFNNISILFFSQITLINPNLNPVPGFIVLNLEKNCQTLSFGNNFYYYLILFKHPYWSRNSHMVFLKNMYWLEKSCIDLEKHALTSGKHLFISAIDRISWVLPNCTFSKISWNFKIFKKFQQTLQNFKKKFKILKKLKKFQNNFKMIKFSKSLKKIKFPIKFQNFNI